MNNISELTILVNGVERPIKEMSDSDFEALQKELKIDWWEYEGIYDPMRNNILYWVYRAAQDGDAEAQIAIGDCLMSGKNVKKDEKEAITWYRRAAEQEKHRLAQFKLAMCYYHGIGTYQSDRLAFKWVMKSAHQGYDEALYFAGYFFEKGIGVEGDLKTALKWYYVAAWFGNKKAKKLLKMRRV